MEGDAVVLRLDKQEASSSFGEDQCVVNAALEAANLLLSDPLPYLTPSLVNLNLLERQHLTRSP